MEKKNSVVLTVIAIAVLLIGVLGASFAYFTSSIKVRNEENSKTTVKTATLVSASMDMGQIVTSTDALPGYKALKTVTVKGAGKEGDQAVNAIITLTPNVTDFGNHIKYSLYKVSTSERETKGVTCTESKVASGTNAYDEMTCDTTKAGNEILSGTFTNQNPVTKEIKVNYNDDFTYYLLVEYVNEPEADQNEEQGKTFTVKIDFEAKA